DEKEHLRDLQAQATEISKKGSGEMFFRGLVGDDAGAGDVQNDTNNTQANLNRDAAQLKQLETQIDALMQDLSGQQDRMNGAVSDNQKLQQQHRNAVTESLE